MAGEFSYQDFDLLVEPDAPGSYRARVLRSPVGESASVRFALPFTPLELENFVLRVGLVRRRTRGPGRPDSAPLKDFGGKLYSAVFQDELREVLQASLGHARAHGMGMRLRLRLTDAPELAELPWEFLYDPRHNRFLAQSRHTPLVRYLDLPDPPRPLQVTGPLRLLVMISSPVGYPPLDVEHEWDVLTGALAGQQTEGRVVVERLAANMSMLQERLRREAFHVVHFVGHGLYRPDWRDGALVMEDRNGQPHEVPGEELGGLLSEYDPTRLVVLNACEGARSGASDPFAGIAQSLVQQGLPAVVAMQFEITDDAAINFARGLYGAIADGYRLEAALAEARRAILHEGNPTEWATPVLYSRAPDGRLFDVTVPARIPQDPRQAPDEAERTDPEQADSRPAGPHEPAPSARPVTAARPGRHEPQPRILQIDRISGISGAMVLNPDGTRLAIASRDDPMHHRAPSDIQIWDIQTGALVRTLRCPASIIHSLATVTMVMAFSPDGTRLAAGSDDKYARVWDISTGQEKLKLAHGLVTGRWATLMGESVPVQAVAFSPDGTRLATGYENENAARVWDAATGQEKLRLKHGYPGLATAISGPGSACVFGVAFSPDGTHLATASRDNSARVWDAATGQQRLLLSHGHFVEWVAFSPDGTRLATASLDKTTRVWDAATGEQQLQLSHDHQVNAVVFSPDSTRLATIEGSAHTVLRIWDATTGQQLRITSPGSRTFSSDGSRLAVHKGKIVEIWDTFGE
jgi:WD40 repeat protein